MREGRQAFQLPVVFEGEFSTDNSTIHPLRWLRWLSRGFLGRDVMDSARYARHSLHMLSLNRQQHAVRKGPCVQQRLHGGNHKGSTVMHFAVFRIFLSRSNLLRICVSLWFWLFPFDVWWWRYYGSGLLRFCIIHRAGGTETANYANHSNP